MSYIVKQKDGCGHTRIYLATNHHDSNLQQARQTRVYIGVLDQITNELLVNSKLEKLDNVIIRKLKKKGIRYLGKKAGAPGRKRKFQKIEINEEIKIFKIETGKTQALYYLAEWSGLTNALNVAFGKSANQILTLAIHQATTKEPMYMAQDWAQDNGIDESLSSSTTSRLLSNTKTSDIDIFFQEWIKACGKPYALVHDTTSISTYAKNLELAEWGYNRDEENLPQVNLAIVVAKETRLPLWCRVIPGSIPDVSTLKLTSTILKSLGLNSFSFSLDRGYYSASNLADMIKNELEFTIGVPLSNGQALSIVRKNRKYLNTLKRSFLYGSTRMRYISTQFKIKDKNLSAHLYLDPDRKAQLSKKIEITVLELERKASAIKFINNKEATIWIKDNAGDYSKFLSTKDKKVIVKTNTLSKALCNLGITLIVTNNTNTRETVLSDYRSRDIAEKVFDIYKNGVGADRLHSNNIDCVTGRIFISFLATIIRSLVESKLRSADLIKNYSVSEALVLLGKIKRIRLADGRVAQLEIPKKSLDVAEALGFKAK